MAQQSSQDIKRQWGGSDLEVLKQLVERSPIFGEVSINPANLAAGAEGETTVSIAAALPSGVSASAGDLVFVMPPSNLEAGLMLKTWRISATNTLGVTLRNVSGGAVDGAALTWTFCLIRSPRFTVI
jgi:hypothetical protein